MHAPMHAPMHIPRPRAESHPNLRFSGSSTNPAHTTNIKQQRNVATPVAPPTEAKNKHQEFVYKHGAKLHAYSQQEAPWPFSYNREVLEQCGIDHALVAWGRGSQIFFNFQEKAPKRCLDLGTTMGDWIIDTARHLPECTFVGFDLMDIQIPLSVIPQSVAERIEWVHGNFLQFPLPFKDDEFDYIHAGGIGLGVPENKWHLLFEELNRILAPGGYIEIVQQDALFPVLPRWFTNPLHAHLHHFTEDLPDGANPELPPVSDDIPHAYALLEELFYGVFDSRFINPKPSSMIPVVFSTYFRQVVSPPVLHFPMPPLAPLAPFPQRSGTQRPTNETTSDPLDATRYFIPASDEEEAISPIEGKKPELHIDISGPSSSSSYASDAPPTPTTPIHQTHHHHPSSPLASVSSLPSSPDRTRRTSTSSTTTTTSVRSAAILNSTSTWTTRLGRTLGAEAAELFKIDKLSRMGHETLFMHLHQAAGMVLGAREAMWGELLRRLRARDPALARFGWGAPGAVEAEWRERFDAYVARYERDMHVRLSMWHSLVKSGWAYPRREHMTPAEREQEEGLRRAILEARKQAREEDFATPSRSVRLLIGVKGT